MSNVRIMADSTCDLSPELKEKYDIKVIPLCIVMDDESYFDMVDVTPLEIFEWADKNESNALNTLPKCILPVGEGANLPLFSIWRFITEEYL